MATIDRVDYDAELQRHNEVLRRGWGIRPHDRVLDVGCGAGQTTRDAARLAEAGSALGVDISVSMIERARELAKAEGILRNVAFVQADASVHQFPSDEFDIVDQPIWDNVFRRPCRCICQSRTLITARRASDNDGVAGCRAERVGRVDPASALDRLGWARNFAGSARSVLACRSEHDRADPRRLRLGRHQFYPRAGAGVLRTRRRRGARLGVRVFVHEGSIAANGTG